LIAALIAANWAASQTATLPAHSENHSATPSVQDAPSSTYLPSNFELLRTRYRFESDGTGRKEVTAKIRILNQMGALQQGESTFEYKPYSEELQIPYFRVKKKDGSLVDIKTQAVQELNQPTPDQLGQDFDHDERRVTVPGLAPGDLIEYETVTVIHRPLGPGEFFVQHNFEPNAVADEQLEVDVPMDRKVRVKSIPTVTFWETSDDLRRVYHWRNLNLDLRQEATRFVPGRTPDVQVSSFQSWEEVGRWYQDLEKSQRAVTPDVKAKADELTQGLNSDFEKVLALYDFAARKIKYLDSFSLGIAGFIPHSASETLHHQNGDCKDKVALLSALLEAEGLSAASALISSDRHLAPDIPSPWPFTHVIMTLRLGREEVWMDPSPIGLPFRMLIPSLRGKEALVIPSRGAPRFEKTPSSCPIANTWSEEVEGTILNDGALEAKVHIRARGDVEFSLRQAFIGPIESVWPIVVQMNVKGIERRTDEISEVKIGDPTATNESFTLSFRVRKPHFADFSQGIARFRFPLADFDLPSAVEQGMMDKGGGWHRIESEPVPLGPPGKRLYRITLKLPYGFYPHLPESVIFECSGGEYRATYEWDGISLTAQRDLLFTRERLPAHLRNEYSAFRTRVEKDEEWVVQARTGDHERPDERKSH
jgi:hypothetical protein